ncbi:MAG: 3-phosphoshikimate 1-carboxyvinyltransferase [Opitutaceae bacterium]|nr:3-phosphoshikimate 1-carboxyvinyltransferase [Opitutaceae bacterium]
MSLPDPLPVTPFTRPARGSVTLPGSKSITNRALILAALSDRTVTLRGALFSRDTRIMLAALRTLGFHIETDEAALTIVIEGRGGAIPVREAKIDVGNAGTAARFLTAFVCLRPDGSYHFDGDEAMRRRPIGALLEALAAQGAQADAHSFPFTLRTAGLPGGEVVLDASESSQMLSALLMVAPHARSPLTVKLKGEAGSKPFVQMTEAMLRQFAARPADYQIEGDASAASYFLALPLVTGGSLTLTNYGGSLQGDVKFRDVVTGIGPARRAVDRNFREYSDTFLTLAAIAPLLDGPTRITGIAHTRKQETDRVAGMARELSKLGQRVIETEDALEIHPRPLRAGQVIETYHDHRFAMSFGILGCHDLHGDGRPWLSIQDPACCAKTFPHFFELLENLRQKSLGD